MPLVFPLVAAFGLVYRTDTNPTNPGRGSGLDLPIYCRDSFRNHVFADAIPLESL